jgi:hypothetical protein
MIPTQCEENACLAVTTLEQRASRNSGGGGGDCGGMVDYSLVRPADSTLWSGPSCKRYQGATVGNDGMINQETAAKVGEPWGKSDHYRFCDPVCNDYDINTV